MCSSYCPYLKCQNEKIQFNQNPHRQLSDDVSVKCIKRNLIGIYEEYKHIYKVTALADVNEPVFNEKEHLHVLNLFLKLDAKTHIF